MIEQLRPVINEKMATAKAQADAKAYAESPEARAKIAKGVAEKLREREALADSARALLASEGYPGNELGSLSDDEVLHLSRIDVRPELLSAEERDAAALHLVQSGEWGQLDEMARFAAARDLSGDGDARAFLASMDNYAAMLTGQDRGGEDGGEDA
ncbi:MAG TPA: hypothetical protein VK915_03830 [Gaiellaceae bacterium]|nr:hypothetical protein [Gaiellaceae bacterium]